MFTKNLLGFSIVAASVRGNVSASAPTSYIHQNGTQPTAFHAPIATIFSRLIPEDSDIITIETYEDGTAFTALSIPSYVENALTVLMFNDNTILSNEGSSVGKI